MRPPLFERKWELDSLCSALRLASEYVVHTGDMSPIDEAYVASVETVLKTLREQQRGTAQDVKLGVAYQFSRVTPKPTDTLELAMGPPARHTGPT